MDTDQHPEKKLSKTYHYVGLDGLRGIAALSVVGFHSGDFLGPLRPNSAYLAVDFFFVLSGFVLAHAYDSRIGSALSAAEFVRKRFVRFFPLYFAGSAITIVGASLILFVNQSSYWTSSTLIISALFALFMLPSPVTPHLFPLNLPAWSLFFEIVINGLYGCRLFQRWFVWVVPSVAAVGLIAESVICGSLDSGATWGEFSSTLLWGSFRVAYSFPVGLLLYRYRSVFKVIALPISVLAIVLAALFYVDVSGVYRGLFDLGFVLLASPMLVLIGSKRVLRTPHQLMIWGFLGTISYPIYAIHQPVIVVVTSAINMFHGPMLPAIQRLTGLILLLALVAISAGADKVDLLIRYQFARRKLRQAAFT